MVVLWRETGNETGNEKILVERIDVHVKAVLSVIGGRTMTVKEIMKQLGLKGDDNFRNNYLIPAIQEGFVVMLYPDKPKRKGQAYYLTPKGLSAFDMISTL